MTSATAPPPKPAQLVQVAEANEWGQLTGLDPHATYFVVRRPHVEMGREKGKEFTEGLRSFMATQRQVAENQFKQLDERYGTPARQKVQEVRERVEKRFDEISRELETAVERLETEFQERRERMFRKPESGTQAETPGEMPRGEGPNRTE